MGKGQSDKALVSFNAGEWSPRLDARIDLEKASSACRRLENFLIESYGSARRRPGTQYITSTKFGGTRKSTLWRFQFSTTTTYAIEVGHEYMRFAMNGAPVLVSLTPYEISTIYQENDLFEIQFFQVNDVVFITHPNYPIHLLSRVGPTDWTIEEVEFTNPPFLAENLTAVTIAPTAGGDDSEVVLEASADVFTDNHLGSYWTVGHLRAADSKEVAIASNTTSDEIGILGPYEVRTYGVWEATVLIQRSLDSGTTWETVRKFKGKSDRNVDATGDALENALYRLKIEDYVDDDGGRAVIEAPDAVIYGVAKITAVVDGSAATAAVIQPFLAITASDIWAEGAWSLERGYPRALTLHEQRLVFGGTVHEPQTVRGSVIGDYINFLKGVADDAAYAFTLDGEELNAIQWLRSETALLAGTTGGEWKLASRSQETGITAKNVDIKQQSSYGSEYIQAISVNEVVLFVQRKGKCLREMTYSYSVDKYVAANLTLLAEHVTKGRIVSMARQIDPISIVWCVMADGTLAGLTYDREQNVVGWHRHPMDGFVENVCTLYGAKDQDDEVWLTVRRTIQGEDQRFIERMNPNQWVEKEDCFFVDAGATYDGAPTTTISGLDYLEGKDVAVLADGDVIEGLAVTGGDITLAVAASKVHVGLPYTSLLVPFRIDNDSTIGVTSGRIRKIAKIIARFLDTLGCVYTDGERTFELPFRNTGTPFDVTTPIFTGDKEIDFGTGFAYDTPITIKQTQPLPMTIQGLVPKYVVTSS